MFRTLRSWCSLALLLLLTPVAFGAEAALPKAAEEALRQFDESVKEAREVVFKAVDEQVDAVAKTGNLSEVKALQSDKENFEKYGIFPKALKLKPAVTKSRAMIKAAYDKAKLVLESAIKEHTKAKDFDTAERVQKALDSHVRTWGEIASGNRSAIGSSNTKAAATGNGAKVDGAATAGGAGTKTNGGSAAVAANGTTTGAKASDASAATGSGKAPGKSAAGGVANGTGGTAIVSVPVNLDPNKNGGGQGAPKLAPTNPEFTVLSATWGYNEIHKQGLPRQDFTQQVAKALAAGNGLTIDEATFGALPNEVTSFKSLNVDLQVGRQVLRLWLNNGTRLQLANATSAKGTLWDGGPIQFVAATWGLEDGSRTSDALGTLTGLLRTKGRAIVGFHEFGEIQAGKGKVMQLQIQGRQTALMLRLAESSRIEVLTAK